MNTMNIFEQTTLWVRSSFVASPASKMTMKCPNCGAARLIHDTRDMSYTYKGEHTTIMAVTGDFCPACGEVVLDREQGDRYIELLGQFQRQVNNLEQITLRVRSSFVASPASKLDLTPFVPIVI